MWLERSGTWSFLIALTCIAATVESGHYSGGAEASFGAREASADSECKTEGYSADPRDCKLYYRCVDWGQSGKLTKFKFECGPGTVFSKQRGDVCTHPYESGRSECGGSDEIDNTNDVDSNNAYYPVKEEPANSRPVYPYPTNGPSHGSSSGPLSVPPSGPSYVPPSGSPPGPTTGRSTPGIINANKPTSARPSQPSGGTAATLVTANTDRTPIQAAVGNECRANGFLADPQDCSKFYRCVDTGKGSYKKHEFSCGEGTVWDPEIESCNHPWAANRADCKTSQPNPSQNNDNGDEPYQNGPNSDPHVSSVAPPPPCRTETPPPAGEQQGTVPPSFSTPNPHEESTSGAQQPQDGSQQGSLPSNEAGQPSQTTSGSPQPTTSPSGEPQKPESSKPGSPPLSKDEACRSEGFFGDTEDCSKFYRCVNSGSKLTKYEFKCGDGTVWDDRIASCNHKYAVPKCGGSDQGAGDGNQQPGDTGNEIETDQGNGNGNEGTGDIDNEVGPRPDPDSSSGDSTSSSAQTPSPADGTTKPLGVDQGSMNTGGTTASPGITENSSQANPSPGTVPVGSDAASTSQKPSTTGTSEKGDCTAEGFFSDPENCSKFYRCVSSGSKFTKYEFQCGEGTVWDEKITSCNHKSAVPRCGGADQRPDGEHQRPDETNNEIGTEQGTGNGDNQPDKTNNEVEQGPDSGSSPVDSIGGSGQPPNPPDSGSSTVDSTSSSARPPNPTVATTESSIVTEGSTNSAESSTVTSSPTEGTGGSSSSSTPGGSESSTSEKPSSGGSLENGQCTREGFFSDPENCKKFYRCVAGEGSKLTKYEFSCGEGTAWDDKIQSCNHAYAVPGCGETAGAPGGQSPDGNSPSGGSPGDNSDGGQGETGANSESNPSEPTTTSSIDLTSSEIPASPEQESQEPSSTTQASGVSSGTSSASENETPGESSSTIQPSSQASEGTTPAEGNEPSIQTSSTTEPSNQSSEGPTPTSETEPPGGSSSTTPPSDQSPDGATPDGGNQVPTGPSSTAEPSGPSSAGENEIPNELQTSSTPASMVTQGSQSTTGQSSSNGQGGTSGGCNNEGFFPNKNDCRKFYRCVAGGRGGYTKYEFSCAPGTAWDQNILTCNHIYLVPSCIDASTNEVIGEKEEGSVATTSVPGSSSTPGRPVDGSPNESPNTGGNVPSSGKPAEVTRPVESTSESSSESTSETSSGSSESTSESSSGSSETTSESSSATSSSEPSSENGSGPRPCDKPKPTGIVCNEAGFNAHPTRCDKFYRCVDNGNGFNVYHFDCPPGTIFDPSIDVCNYPESVYPARDCQNVGPDSSGGSTESGGGQGSSTGSTESSEGPSTGPTSTESISTTGKVEEMATSTEAVGESTSEETGSEAPGETTESTESEGTTGASGEPTPEATTQNPDNPTAEVTTDISGESATELTTASSGESPEAPQTTIGQEEPTTLTPTSTESEASTASQEVPTTEAAEQTTIEEQQQSTESSGETSTSTEGEAATSVATDSGESTTQQIPPGATPCPLGNLSGEQIVLVCPTGFRRHPKYCNIFYQCISEATMEVKILSFSCPENTIFDEAKVQCLPENESSQPCTGVKAGARFYRRVESSSTALMKVEKRETLCPDVGHYPYREGCSNVFYKCKRDTRNALQGYVYKCPEDFVYWSVSRRCERASRLPMCTARYSSKRDHIDNETYMSRWQLPIEDYNLSARMLRYPY